MSLEAEIKSGSAGARAPPLFSGGARDAGIHHRAAPAAACGKARRCSRGVPGISGGCSTSKALARLPEMSVILYHREAGKGTGRDSEDDEQAIYVPVEPCDPFVEALRTAEEIGAQVIFLEPDSAERPHLPDAYPDTYATRRIGLDKYIEAYRVYPQMRTDEVTAHAAAMAWKLQGADPGAKVFVVVALNMLDPLLDAMETPQAARRARCKRYEIRCC